MCNTNIIAHKEKLCESCHDLLGMSNTSKLHSGFWIWIEWSHYPNYKRITSITYSTLEHGNEMLTPAALNSISVTAPLWKIMYHTLCFQNTSMNFCQILGIFWTILVHNLATVYYRNKDCIHHLFTSTCCLHTHIHTQFLLSEGILESTGKRFSHFNFSEVTVSLAAS